MTCNTWDNADCRSSASFNSTASRAISTCSLATEAVERVVCLDALLGLNFDKFGRCAFRRWPLTLERLFIGSSLAQGGILARPTSMPEVVVPAEMAALPPHVPQMSRPIVALKTIRDYRCEI